MPVRVLGALGILLNVGVVYFLVLLLWAPAAEEPDRHPNCCSL